MSKVPSYVYDLFHGKIECVKMRVAVAGKIKIKLNLPYYIVAYSSIPASIKIFCTKTQSRLILGDQIYVWSKGKIVSTSNPNVHVTKEAEKICDKLIEITSKCTGTTNYWRR